MLTPATQPCSRTISSSENVHELSIHPGTPLFHLAFKKNAILKPTGSAGFLSTKYLPWTPCVVPSVRRLASLWVSQWTHAWFGTNIYSLSFMIIWIFIARTDAEAPILWEPDVKSQITRKDPNAGKDWRQEKGMTEDEMVGWHHRLNGHEFEQTQGDNKWKGSLGCCSPWGHEESDTT